jgi:hypothetical protein
MSFGIPVRNGLSIGIGTLVSLTSGSGVGGRSRRPALYFDFLTTTSLDSRITFSRTTQATLVDATGRVTYAPNNLLTNSESFEASVWTKTRSSITPNAAVAPDGTTTADKLVTDTTAGSHIVFQQLSTQAAGSYVFSVYAKAAELSSITLQQTISTTYGATFNLLTGAVSGLIGGAVGTATAVGDGWYRCSIAYTTTSSIALTGAIYTGFPPNDGTSGVFIWGAQIEAVTYQTTPGTYNSTTPKNLLGFTQEFDNAAWTKSNAFVQTNLLLRSEEFNNAFWTNSVTGTGSAPVITANVGIAPDGTETADQVVFNSGAGTTSTDRSLISSSNVSVTASATYTHSIFVKGAAGTKLVMRGVNASSYASITLTGEWDRVTGSEVAASSSGAFEIGIRQGVTGTINSTATVLLWGAQLVQGATAGDYQPTYATAAAVQYVAPDGTLSAEALQETTATGLHLAQQFFTFASGVPYTVSAYVKAGSRTWVQLLLPGAAFTASQGGFFNLTGDGSLGTATGTPTARSITAVGNGWYRISVTATSTAAAGGNIPIVAASADGTTSYAGSDTSPALFVWGAQLSNSASLDPYVYNPAAAPTSAAYYGPRFDYNPVTLAPRGLLIEEQRTNRTLNSEDFTAATWVATVVGTSTRVNDGAPLGFTRGLITATSATGGIRQIHSGLTSGQVYALSFYIQSTATSVQIVFENGTSQFGSGHNVTINPSNGTAGVLTGFTSVSIQPFGPGYVYTLITAPAGGALSANIEWRITNSGNSIWLGRPQFEAGAFATSYIPTVASQVTRATDVATIAAPNFASWFNQTEGTLVASVARLAIGTADAISATLFADGNNIIELFAKNTDSRVLSIVGGVTQVNLIDAGKVSASVPYTSGVAYRLNDYALATNAGTVLTDTSATVPTVTILGIGSRSGALPFNGHIRSIRYYPVRLTNAQLQALTA